MSSGSSKQHGQKSRLAKESVFEAGAQGVWGNRRQTGPGTGRGFDAKEPELTP